MTSAALLLYRLGCWASTEAVGTPREDNRRGEMFVTVLFGESKMELFNINCQLIHFVHNLKERCGVDMKDCVDLMNCSGAVVNLESKLLSLDLASSLLAERQNYVLVQVSRNDDDGSLKYVSLLKSVSPCHQEVKELLRRLCNPGLDGDKKVNALRRGRTQKRVSTSQN
ncbi:uncharacterized protein C22orf15-like isoform X2 [Nerophis lumbriciformis]|uniref:uncharacterized protein C22orf15-like isoform X2 n=1 Tax=Nerophis lumbriciformis TaxID=546530 RepID=UPI003BAA1E29